MYNEIVSQLCSEVKAELQYSSFLDDKNDRP